MKCPGKRAIFIGIDLNLNALKQLKDEFPEFKWQYKIIGDGYKRTQLEKLTKKYKLEKNIKFLGYRKKNYVFKALYNSDIFLSEYLTTDGKNFFK